MGAVTKLDVTINTVILTLVFKTRLFAAKDTVMFRINLYHYTPSYTTIILSFGDNYKGEIIGFLLIKVLTTVELFATLKTVQEATHLT